MYTLPSQREFGPPVQAQAEEPLGTDSHQTISKWSNECWLLIGTKNALYYCAQSVNSISSVLFVSLYTTATDLIMAFLAHAPKKCRQSGNFQFDTNSPLGNSRKYPYPTTDGVHVLTPPCLRKFQNALPPPPHALRIP